MRVLSKNLIPIFLFLCGLSFTACSGETEAIGAFSVPIPPDAKPLDNAFSSPTDSSQQVYRVKSDYSKLSDWYAKRLPLGQGFDDWEWCAFKNFEDNARHLIYQSKDESQLLYIVLIESPLIGRFHSDGSKVKVSSIRISLRDRDSNSKVVCTVATQ